MKSCGKHLYQKRMIQIACRVVACRAKWNLGFRCHPMVDCMCVVQYLIKVNEIKTKKGADLLQHLVDYYQAQHKYRL